MTQTNYQNTLAVFDLDNTLIDSKRKLDADVRSAMERLGIDMAHEDAGKDWYEMATSYGFSREQFDQEFDKRKTWEQSLRDGEVPIFSETHDVLSYLQDNGMRMALLSKSIPSYTETKLDYFDLRKYFEAIETIHPKEPSKAQGAKSLLDKLNLDGVEQAWCIGDKPEDVVIAEDIEDEYDINAGGIYVNRRNREIPESVQNYHSVQSLEELPEIIGT